MFKTRGGGGGQRPFKQCLKKLHNWCGMASLTKTDDFFGKCPMTGVLDPQNRTAARNADEKAD